jgi:hypothetical protein
VVASCREIMTTVFILRFALDSSDSRAICMCVGVTSEACSINKREGRRPREERSTSPHPQPKRLVRKARPKSRRGEDMVRFSCSA